MQTNWLLAGHGPRHPRQPLTPAQVAARIVASIEAHAAEGIARQPTEYTQKPETLVLVQAMLAMQTHIPRKET